MQVFASSQIGNNKKNPTSTSHMGLQFLQRDALQEKSTWVQYVSLGQSHNFYIDPYSCVFRGEALELV